MQWYILYLHSVGEPYYFIFISVFTCGINFHLNFPKKTGWQSCRPALALAQVERLRSEADIATSMRCGHRILATFCKLLRSKVYNNRSRSICLAEWGVRELCRVWAFIDILLMPFTGFILEASIWRLLQLAFSHATARNLLAGMDPSWWDAKQPEHSEGSIWKAFVPIAMWKKNIYPTANPGGSVSICFYPQLKLAKRCLRLQTLPFTEVWFMDPTTFWNWVSVVLARFQICQMSKPSDA